MKQVSIKSEDLERYLRFAIDEDNQQAKKELQKLYQLADPTTRQTLRVFLYQQTIPSLDKIDENIIYQPYFKTKLFSLIRKYPYADNLETAWQEVMSDVFHFLPEKMPNQLKLKYINSLKEDFIQYLKEEEKQNDFFKLGTAMGILGFSGLLLSKFSPRFVRLLGKIARGDENSFKVASALSSTIGGGILLANAWREWKDPDVARENELLKTLMGLAFFIGGIETKFRNPFAKSPLHKISDITSADFLTDTKKYIESVRAIPDAISSAQNLKMQKHQAVQPLADILTREESSVINLTMLSEKFRHHLQFAFKYIDEPEVSEILLDPKKINSIIDRVGKGEVVDKLSPAEQKAFYVYLARNYGKLLTYLSKFNTDKLVMLVNHQNELYPVFFLSFDDFLKKFLNASLKYDVILGKAVSPEELEKGVPAMKFLLADGNEIHLFAPRTFKKDYSPSFARPVIIKAEKEGKIKKIFTNEIELEDEIQELLKADYKIAQISLPSTSAFDTRRFRSEIRQVIENAMKNELKVSDIRETVDEAIAKYLHTPIYELRKTTFEGFFAEHPELLKDPEFRSHYLKTELASKWSGLYSNMKNLEETYRMMSRGDNFHAKVIADYLEKFIERPTKDLSFWQSVIKSYWLLLNFKVRALNTLALPFVITMKAIAQNPERPITEFTELFATAWKGFTKGIGKFSSDISDFYESSIVKITESFTKAPFQAILNSMVDEIVKNDKLVNLLFPNVKLDKESLKDYFSALLLSDTELAKPSFFSFKISNQRLEKVLDTVSAFFVPNYLPAYYSAKAIAQPFVSILLGKKTPYTKILSAFVGASLLTSLYGTLVGARNVPPVGQLIALSDFTDSLAHIVSEDISRYADYFTIQENLARIFGLTSFFNGLLDNELFGTILFGNGLIGMLTGTGTEAGALTFPQLGDAPVLEFIKKFSENVRVLKNTDPNTPEYVQYLNALLKTAVDITGIARRVGNTLYSDISSFFQMPASQPLSDRIRQFLFPKQIYPISNIPPALNFADAKKIQVARERASDSYTFMLGALGKLAQAGDTKAIEQTLQHLVNVYQKQIKLIKPRKEMGVELLDDTKIKNAIFLYIFLKDLGIKKLPPPPYMEKFKETYEELENRLKFAKLQNAHFYLAWKNLIQ